MILVSVTLKSEFLLEGRDRKTTTFLQRLPDYSHTWSQFSSSSTPLFLDIRTPIKTQPASDWSGVQVDCSAQGNNLLDQSLLINQ